MSFAAGSLVTARGREWVVLPSSDDELLPVRPLDGDAEFVAGLFPEEAQEASFPWPSTAPGEIGDDMAARLLRTALRIGFTSSAGPFRSLAQIAVDPRHYQLVPLLLALRMETVRLLIGDDVGIGKTVEAGLVAKELLARGEATGLTVLCSPALAEQWQAELRDKFGIEATLVLPSTVTKLARDVRADESLFERHPYTVVSTEFIKSESRRYQFLRTCPDLVIVDEAHTCVPATGRARGRQQRYELLQEISADPSRHLVLVTATPHSGSDSAFRSLVGLLDAELAAVDLDKSSGRDRLARHFVQRRRRDIRNYLDEETRFPADRQTREVAYQLSDDYAALTTRVLDYARETVREPGGALRQRVRWWSALALLRSVVSSPRAAAATLHARSATAAAQTVSEADDLGRASVLDLTDEDTEGGVDASPGSHDSELPRSTRDRLRALAHEAQRVDAGVAQQGVAADAKLAALLTEVKRLLADGYDPIVFARFIPTAQYVAEHLGKALGRKATVTAVTGELPPAERAARIEDLAGTPGRHVLVATDCLSEGVNLQQHFQAVVHYDLAWNPTRHEQREGRVDRFGQPRRYVRAVTLYGMDNGIDGVVLDVLIRKHRAIAEHTGVSVPVPTSSDNVVEALAEGLLLRGEQAVGQSQLVLDVGLEERTTALHREWESSAERESRTVTKYAQSGIKLEEVRREVEAVRASLGDNADVASFVRAALSALGAHIKPDAGGFTVSTIGLPAGVRDALGLSEATDTEELVFRGDLPVRPGEHALVRTDPLVVDLARYVREAALDPQLPPDVRPARRCGVIRTSAVTARTTLLLVRYRFHVTLPGRSGRSQALIAEDARVVAYQSGSGGEAEWLDDDEVASLLAAVPDGNVLPEKVQQAADRAVVELDDLVPALNAGGDELAEGLRDAHQRVRGALGQRSASLRVAANHPVDVLGVYVYLPVAGGPQ